MRRSKLPNFREKNEYLIQDNYKVILFHFFDYLSLLIPKLYSKIKQKLAPYEAYAKNRVFIAPNHISQYVMSLLSIMVNFCVGTTQESFGQIETFVSKN